MDRKKTIITVIVLILIPTLCACLEQKSKDFSSSATTPQAASSQSQKNTEPSSASTFEAVESQTVTMTDGSIKTVTLTNGFYQFATGSSVKISQLVYLRDAPTPGAATLKLIFENEAPNAIAFLLPKHIAHGDYQTAWENADSILNIEDFNADGLYGADTSFAMPADFWNYEIRVFDDRQAENQIELAFVPLAAEDNVKIGELIRLDAATSLKITELTLSTTEYKVGDNIEITGQLDAEGFGNEAWIGVVPSGVSHGDDEQNDTYDTDYDYLDLLENGKFTLAIPETAGNYDLRICDGTVEVAYMTFVVR